ncbi:MAG: hypothetical protein R3C56_33030 [Pirellulaceae bacterium]
MGTGCERVARVQAEDADIITGVWQGGRVGTFRGIRRNKAKFGAVAFGSTGIAQTDTEGGYEELCHEIGKFFKTGQAPVALKKRSNCLRSWRRQTKANDREEYPLH